MSLGNRRYSDTGARGLTLAELVVAAGILGFVGLSVIGVFLVLLNATAKNREQAQAEMLAERLLETACVQGPPGWGVDGGIGVRKQETAQKDGTTFFYQVDPVKVPSLSMATIDSNYIGDTWQVAVTVGWWQEGVSGSLENSRSGLGDQYVKAARTVYYRDSSRW